MRAADRLRDGPEYHGMQCPQVPTASPEQLEFVEGFCTGLERVCADVGPQYHGKRVASVQSYRRGDPDLGVAYLACALWRLKRASRETVQGALCSRVRKHSLLTVGPMKVFDNYGYGYQHINSQYSQ